MHMQLVKTSGLSGQQMVTSPNPSPPYPDPSLILSLRRKAPPPQPLPPSPKLRPLGLFWCLKSELIVVQPLWQWRRRHHPNTSSNLVTIRSLQRNDGKPPHWKKKKKIPASSESCVQDFSLFFFTLLKFPGERNASYSAEIYHDPPRLWGVAAQQRFFSWPVFFLFWALISCVSSARHFPTLCLPSIIHNPQLFLPSHSTTHLQMIIFLFWNVWKGCCPAAVTLGYGCWESRFHMFCSPDSIFSPLNLIKRRNRSLLSKLLCFGRVCCFSSWAD